MINVEARTVYSLDLFTLPEIQLLVAAYSYEYLDLPVISDYHYDITSYLLESRMVKKMPEFASYSGMWIKEVTVDLLPEVTKYVTENLGPDGLAHIPIIREACQKFGVRYEIDPRFELVYNY